MKDKYDPHSVLNTKFIGIDVQLSDVDWSDD